jgi:hypothetical protein
VAGTRDRGKARGGTGVQPTPEQILKRCEEYLRSPETDWDSIYVRVRTSALGADFPRERFLRTPIGLIRWILRQLDEREQALANMAALPTARLTQLVVQIAHGFSGSRRPAPKMKVQDFLPYPKLSPASAEAEGPDDPTKFILTELGRSHRIPMHVFVALMTPVERQP